MVSSKRKGKDKKGALLRFLGSVGFILQELCASCKKTFLCRVKYK